MFTFLYVINRKFGGNILMCLHLLFVFWTLLTQNDNEGQKSSVCKVLNEEKANQKKKKNFTVSGSVMQQPLDSRKCNWNRRGEMTGRDVLRHLVSICARPWLSVIRTQLSRCAGPPTASCDGATQRDAAAASLNELLPLFHVPEPPAV